MKNIFLSLTFLIISFQGISQTLDISLNNLTPTESSFLESDTLLIDYNIGCDTLMYDDLNKNLVLSLIELSYVDEYGYLETRGVKRKELKDKVVIVYSSLWGIYKVIDK